METGHRSRTGPILWTSAKSSKRNEAFRLRVPRLLCCRQATKTEMQLAPFRGMKQLGRAAAILLAAIHLLLAVAPHALPAAVTGAHAHLHAPGDELELPHDETACLPCTRDVITGAARITSAPSLIWAS